MMVGGSHERRQRAGTENVPGIVGLGKAAELAMESLEDGAMIKLAELRDQLEAGILKIPGTRVNGGWEGQTRVPRTANTTNISFDNVEGEALVIALDLKGVAVSGGSACHSGSTEPSHVLMAMGLDNLAELYWAQAQYTKAEPLALRALTMWEHILGPDHSDIATSLNKLALLYAAQGQ